MEFLYEIFLCSGQLGGSILIHLPSGYAAIQPNLSLDSMPLQFSSLDTCKYTYIRTSHLAECWITKNTKHYSQFHTLSILFAILALESLVFVEALKMRFLLTCFLGATLASALAAPSPGNSKILKPFRYRKTKDDAQYMAWKKTCESPNPKERSPDLTPPVPTDGRGGFIGNDDAGEDNRGNLTLMIDRTCFGVAITAMRFEPGKAEYSNAVIWMMKDTDRIAALNNYWDGVKSLMEKDKMKDLTAYVTLPDGIQPSIPNWNYIKDVHEDIWAGLQDSFAQVGIRRINRHYRKDALNGNDTIVVTGKDLKVTLNGRDGPWI